MPMGEWQWEGPLAESDDDYDARFSTQHHEGRHAGQSGKWWLESAASAGVPSAASAGNPYGGEGPGVATQFPPKTPKRERCGEPCNCLACGPRCCGGQRCCIIRGPHSAINHRCLPCLTRNPIRREEDSDDSDRKQLFDEMSIRCGVCGSYLNGQMQYDDHLRGKKHLKNLKILNSRPATSTPMSE